MSFTRRACLLVAWSHALLSACNNDEPAPASTPMPMPTEATTIAATTRYYREFDEFTLQGRRELLIKPGSSPFIVVNYPYHAITGSPDDPSFTLVKLYVTHQVRYVCEKRGEVFFCERRFPADTGGITEFYERVYIYDNQRFEYVHARAPSVEDESRDEMWLDHFEHLTPDGAKLFALPERTVHDIIEFTPGRPPLPPDIEKLVTHIYTRRYTSDGDFITTDRTHEYLTGPDAGAVEHERESERESEPPLPYTIVFP